MIAYEQVETLWQLFEYRRITCLDGLVHYSKRSGSSRCIGVCEQSSRHWPRGHLNRETNQQKRTTNKCRIERIAAKTAECHLADANGNERTDDDNPYWKVRRHVET